ncbi:hypothetical protein N7493_000906 [Penicillium malachiteum]|uniref:Fungal-type protein kinase domain-containing protein n=1 Tax=Penicillium malachiteum TaxID=1324776 RepID=A0AAD6HX74_9EURO|nr:hypothetical protein N7493_000906 [Penicillium malachiteum]
MWVFDRAGIYGSQGFNIQEKPDLVTQIIASYLRMDNSSLGISHLIKHENRGNYIVGELGGRLYLDDSPIFARVDKFIISDGLTCYRARLQTTDDWSDWSYALKLKGCEPDEGSEAEMLGLATEKQAWGVIRLVEHKNVCSPSE